MKKIRVLTLCAVTLLSPFFANTVAAEQAMVWGSTTCQKRFLEPGNDALKAATGIDVKVVGVGTGKGLLALLKGKAAASAASEDLDGAIGSAKKAAAKSGKSMDFPSDLVYHEIARDTIVPIVHKDNPVSSLTWAQLKDLNTGKIKNWSEVGGPNLPVQIITSHAGSATRSVFQKMVMKKEDYVADAIKVRSTRKEINEVSKHKGAIGAVSEGFFRLNPGQSKIVQTNSISRPLGLITRGEPSVAIKQVIDFYRSEDGKQYIK